ncbi:MAG: glycoside hydrolase [Candidatus Eremiobacteraeota bacterium]|nr:glycoside hydrolase [Candidatus Eremiobacteraeota bacterium]
MSGRLFAAFFLSCALCGPVGAHAASFPQAAFGAMRWRMVGPFRGGRTPVIAGVPQQPNIFYAAANDGGVWKSDDYGRTWTPIFDGQPTGSIGALAVAPTDPATIYAGSGEGLQRPDLSIGDGMYRSNDGGATWTHLGLRDGQQIASIIVDPSDPKRLFVAVLGHPYGANAERGVYRSLDGGATFKNVLYKDADTGAVALAFDPSNAQVIYAALWAARRPPWTTGGSIERPGWGANGLYKSTDGGETWAHLAGGLPANTDGVGRIGISVAPSDPQRIYAQVDSPRKGGLYRSDDAGTTWRRVNDDERISGRGDDFAGVAVDPSDPNRVYVANTSTYRSTDGGTTFTAIKGAPGGDDYHTIWINPQNPHIVMLGSDQGVTISVNDGRTWSSWYNQPTAQFYHVMADNRFPYWICGGQQESGSACTQSRSDTGEISFREWHSVGAEEYGYVAPDPLHPGVFFGGKLTRFDERTGQTQDVSPVPLKSRVYRFNRTAPVIFSRVDPHVLYYGSSVLFSTRDGGRTWRIISPDLTRAAPGVPANLGIFAQSTAARETHRGVIYSVAPSYRTAGTIWAGTDDGLMWITRDGGTHWRNITPAGLTSWSKIAQIDTTPFDDATAYVAVNRFRLDDLRPYVFRTHDGGQHWVQVVSGLPNAGPVNVVRADPVRRGLLYAGTETGVFVSFDDGAHWQPLQLNLPHTSVRDLIVHGDDLAIATHGRSFWILDDVTPLRQLTSRVSNSPAYLFEPQIAVRWRWNDNQDTPLPPEEPAGQNPPDGAIIDYTLARDVDATVTLSIYDSAGRLVRRYASTDRQLPPDTIDKPQYWVRPQARIDRTAGMHRFAWDLHETPPAALEYDYPISAIVGDTPREPRGPWVLPGRYRVELTVGTERYARELNVRMDPRVPASPADLAAQLALAQRIAAAIDRSTAAARHASGTNRDALEKLNAKLIDLLAREQGADAAPTRAQEHAFATLDGQLAPLIR